MRCWDLSGTELNPDGLPNWHDGQGCPQASYQHTIRAVDANGDDDSAGPGTSQCGCAQASGAASIPLLLLLMIPALRRRSRIR